MKNNYALGFGTQLQDMKLELNQYREKNHDLNKVVKKLQNENENLLEERDRARFAAEQRVPDVAKKNKVEGSKLESQARFFQSRDMAMKSMVPPADKTVAKKNNKYDQFHFSDWESVM